MTERFTHWHKSSYSGNQSACVEVGTSSCAVGIRDTKDRSFGTLAVSHAAWTRFIEAVKTGQLSH